MAEATQPQSLHALNRENGLVAPRPLSGGRYWTGDNLHIHRTPYPGGPHTGMHSIGVVFVAGQHIHTCAALSSLYCQLASGGRHFQYAVAWADFGLVEHGGDTTPLGVVEILAIYIIGVAEPCEIDPVVVGACARGAAELRCTSCPGSARIKLNERLGQFARYGTAAPGRAASEELSHFALEGSIQKRPQHLRERLSRPFAGHVALR